MVSATRAESDVVVRVVQLASNARKQQEQVHDGECEQAMRCVLIEPAGPAQLSR
jgi:hypothetical protein